MIYCTGLGYTYSNGAEALINIEFEAKRGQIVGVVGSNGAGKSTLFKCFTGLVKPQKGTITIEGQPLAYDKKALANLRQKVNVVLQDPERQIFFPRVYDDVAFGPRNLKRSADDVAHDVMESLEKTNLVPMKDKPVHYLSYGQKKRVAIAGILAMTCDVMICDEPEAGLDPKMKRQMIEILKQLASENRAIILSSHNMELMLELCDILYVLHEGRLIGSGPTLEVLSNETLMHQANLEVPSLIRIAKRLGLPLVKHEHDLDGLSR